MRHFIVHTRRAGQVVTRRLNCGVIRKLEASTISIRATLIMVFTFALGIAPATWLLFLAVLVSEAGVARLFETGVSPLFNVGNLGVALLGLMTIVLSLFGYVALFHAAGDAVTPRVARWLLGGLVANLVGIGFTIGLPLLLIRPDDVFALFSPLLVGCVHLARYLIGARQRAASV